MKNIIYLSYDGITDPLGQSQILPYLTGLCRLDCKFYLIGFEKPEAYDKQKESILSIIENENITWIPLKYHKSPPIISTVYDIWKMKKKAEKLINDHSIDLIHCRSYISMLVGMMLKKKYGTKILFDMRGFWADERIDGGLWNIKNPVYRSVYRFFKKKEIEFVKDSDHIVSLTETGKEELVSGNLFINKGIKVPDDKITVIPCTTDFELFDPQKVKQPDVKAWHQRLKFREEDKIVVYLGSIGTWYMINEMLQFFRHLKHLNSDYKFLFVTRDDPGEILDKAAGFGIDPNDIIFTSAKREEVPIVLSMSHIGLFFIKPAYSKKASSATKMGEMMAMGLPFIANLGVGDADHIVKDSGGGLLIDLTQGEWNTTLEDIESLEQYRGEPNWTAAKKHFDLNDGVKKYFEIYSKIMSN